jgi:hypothetical protein
MRWIVPVAIVMALTPTPAAAQSAGVVVFASSRCDYYAVETTVGIAVLQWMGGSLPIEGQQVAGDFQRYGMKTLRLTQSQTTKAWVEDFWLSTEKAAALISKKCPRL